MRTYLYTLYIYIYKKVWFVFVNYKYMFVYFFACTYLSTSIYTNKLVIVVYSGVHGASKCHDIWYGYQFFRAGSWQSPAFLGVFLFVPAVVIKLWVHRLWLVAASKFRRAAEFDENVGITHIDINLSLSLYVQKDGYIVHLRSWWYIFIKINFSLYIHAFFNITDELICTLAPLIRRALKVVKSTICVTHTSVCTCIT